MKSYNIVHIIWTIKYGSKLLLDSWEEHLRHQFHHFVLDEVDHVQRMLCLTHLCRSKNIFSKFNIFDKMTGSSWIDRK